MSSGTVETTIPEIPIRWSEYTKRTLYVSLAVFLVTLFVSFWSGRDGSDFSRRELGLYLVVSTLSIGGALAGVLIEALLRLEQLHNQLQVIRNREQREDLDLQTITQNVGRLPIRLEQLHDQLQVIRNREQREDSDLQTIIQNLAINPQLEEALGLAKKLKTRHGNFSGIIDLFVQRHIASMQAILKGRRESSLYFDLSSMPRDEGKIIWKTFIGTARYSFFGIQYRYLEDSFGASDDETLLEYQKELVAELAQTRNKALGVTDVKKNLPVQAAGIGQRDFYTRVFVINDQRRELDKKKLVEIWAAMRAQVKHGITVRYILESRYQFLTAQQWATIGSNDFCLIDRDVEEDQTLLKVKAEDKNIKPCLMVVKYESQGVEPGATVRKTGFEISALNPTKISAAEAVLSAVISGNASRLFVEGDPEFEHFDRFVAYVESARSDERNGSTVPSGATLYPFETKAGNENLACMECLPKPGVRPSLLFLHGAGQSTKERTLYLAMELARSGIGSVLFDFSGHGQSTGTLASSSLEKRVNEALEVYRKKFGDHSKAIHILASSMGGHIALKLMEQSINIEFLGLFSPSVYADMAYSLPFENSDGEFTKILRKDNSWRETSVFDTLEKYQGKILLVTGSKDAIVPRPVFEQLWERGQKATKMHEWIDFADGPHQLHTEYLNRNEEGLAKVLAKLRSMIGVGSDSSRKPS